MLITVDFDGTLTRPDVQAFVKEAITEGHRVIIVTLRHTEKVSNYMFGENPSGWNTDVIKLGKELGCERIFLTNGVEKHKYISPLEPAIHLDDVRSEVKQINENCKTLAIWINKSVWKVTANRILNNKNKI